MVFGGRGENNWEGRTTGIEAGGSSCCVDWIAFLCFSLKVSRSDHMQSLVANLSGPLAVWLSLSCSVSVSVCLALHLSVCLSVKEVVNIQHNFKAANCGLKHCRYSYYTPQLPCPHIKVFNFICKASTGNFITTLTFICNCCSWNY